MAKEKEEKKDDKAPKGAEVPAEEAAAAAKKKKLILLGGGGAVIMAGIGAALILIPFGKGESKMPAKTTGESAEGTAAEGHGEKKDEHGEKKDEHGEKKDEHGEKNDEHGEKNDGHGEKHAANGSDPKLAKLEGIDFGCTYPFQAFHLNLGNPLENRYIRLEVAVEYGCAEEIKAELDKRLPQLRDAVITVTSRKTRELLLSPDGKEQLRKELQMQLNYHMARKIDDVFITDILIE